MCEKIWFPENAREKKKQILLEKNMKKNAQENNVRKRGKNTRKKKGARKISYSL